MRPTLERDLLKTAKNKLLDTPTHDTERSILSCTSYSHSLRSNQVGYAMDNVLPCLIRGLDVPKARRQHPTDPLVKSISFKLE